MRLLDKNQVPVIYCNYSDKAESQDEYGWDTGEPGITYSAPVEIGANVSAEKGIVQMQTFGTLDNYDKTLQIEHDIDIDENTIWFVDKPYEVDGDQTPLYDYTTYRVAKSLNECSVAIRKVRK